MRWISQAGLKLAGAYHADDLIQMVRIATKRERCHVADPQIAIARSLSKNSTDVYGENTVCAQRLVNRMIR